MNKKITKKTKIIVLISLAVVISLMAIIAFAVTGVFNRRLEIQIITEKETVKTGEIQKVLIRNVYSNPNDGNSEKIRIHLRTIDDKPNTTVKLLNVTEGKIDYVCENNKDLTVSVYLNEEKDQNGQVIDSYLEYTLPPGSSTDMELEFIVEAGENGLIESLKLEPEVVDGKKAENDKIDENVIINWKAEYLWDNFKSNVSNSNLVFNNAGINESKIQYTYSLDNKMTEKNGSIYTQNIEIDNELILPKGITLPQGIKQSEENKNQLINSKGENVYEINIKDCKYNVKELVTEKNEEGLDTIKYKVIIENEDIEDYKFNPMNKVEVNLNLNKLNVNTNNLEEQNIKTETDLIITSVSKEGQSVPITTYEANSDTIVNFARSGDISLSKDIISIYKPKDAKATEMEKEDRYIVRPNYNISYQVKVSNNSGMDTQNANVVDILPAVLTLNTEPLVISSKRGLLKSGVDYSYSNQKIEDNSKELRFNIYKITNTESISITYETKVNSEFFVAGEKITNTVSMGNKIIEKTVESDSAKEISLKKEIVSRTFKTIVGSPVRIERDLDKNIIKYYGDTEHYFGTRNPSDEQLEEALSEVVAGDVIEYVIILDNPTNNDIYGKIYDYQPFTGKEITTDSGLKLDTAFGYNIKNWKYYLAGNNQYYKDVNVVQDETAVKNITNNYCKYNYKDFMENALPNERSEPILNSNQGQWTFQNNSGNDAEKEKYDKKIKAYTTYRQTVVVEMPGDNSVDASSSVNDDYQEFVARYSYQSNYGKKSAFNTFAAFYKYSNGKEIKEKESKVISQYPEQQIYLNTGSLGKGEYKEGKVKTLFNKQGNIIEASDLNNNSRTYKADDKQVIVNYIYIFNDSSKEMKISDYEIEVNIPNGFKYLGLTSPKDGGSSGSRTFGNIEEYKYEYEFQKEGGNNYNIWVSNTRYGSPKYKFYPSEGPRTQYNQFYNKDKEYNKNIRFHMLKKALSTGVTKLEIKTDYDEDSISPYTGILLMYAVGVDEQTMRYNNNSGETFLVTMQRKRNSKYNINGDTYANQISPVIKAEDYFAGYPGTKFRQYVSNDGESIGIKNIGNNSNMNRYLESTEIINPYTIFSYFTVQRQKEITYANVETKVLKNSGEESQNEYDKTGEDIKRQKTGGALSTGFDTNYDDYIWNYPLYDGIHRTVDGTVTWKFNIKNVGNNTREQNEIKQNNSNINTVPLGMVNYYLPVNYQTIIDTIDSPYKLKEIYVPKLSYYRYGHNDGSDWIKGPVSEQGGYFEIPDSDPKNKEEMIESGWTYIAAEDCFVYEASIHSGPYVGKTKDAPDSYKNMGKQNQGYTIRVTVKNLEDKSLGYGYDVEDGEKNTNAYQYIIEFMNKYSTYEPLLATEELKTDTVINDLDIYLTFSTNDAIETNYNSCALVISGDNINSEITSSSSPQDVRGNHNSGQVIGEGNSTISVYKGGQSSEYEDLGYGSLSYQRRIIEDNDWTDTSYTDGENVIDILGENNSVEETLTSRQNGNLTITVDQKESKKIKGKLKVESILNESENYLDYHNLVIYDLYGKNTSDDKEKNENNDKSAYNIEFKSIKVTDNNEKTYERGKDYEIFYTTQNLVTEEHHPLMNVKTLKYAANWKKIEDSDTKWIRYDGEKNTGEGAKGFKILFLGENGTVKNGKLQDSNQRNDFTIYVDYDAVVSSEAEADVEHPNILAYTAILNDKSGELKAIREDTTAINVKVNKTEINLTKKIINRDNQNVEKLKEEFEFLIVKSDYLTLNKSTIEAIAKVKIKPGEIIDIGNEDNINIIYGNTKKFYEKYYKYCIFEIPKEGYNQAEKRCEVMGEGKNFYYDYFYYDLRMDFSGIPELENIESINNKRIPVIRLSLRNDLSTNFKLTFTNKYDTQLELKKVDESQNIIRNSVTFNIYDEKGIILKFRKEGSDYNYQETDSDEATEEITFSGITHIYNLPYGKYRLVEENPPIGYAKAEEKEITISNSQNGQKIEISVENQLDSNQEISKIHITKVNKHTREKINNVAKFEIYANEDTKTSQPLEFIKDNDGIYTYQERKTTFEKVNELETYNGEFTIYDLPVGTYYIKEIKAPSGYVKEEKITKIEIKTKKDEIIENIENTPMGNLQILKKDTKGNPLEDVKFEIFDSEDKVIKFTKEDEEYKYSENGEITELTTNEEGKIIISDILVGKYKIKETEAQETFELCQDTEIEINEEDFDIPKVVEIINKHNIGNAQIIKTDIDGNVIESNQIGFKIYDEKDNAIRFEDNKLIKQAGREYRYSEDGNYTTIMANNGKIHINELPVGKYYIEEVIAPKGYTKIENKKEFEITDENFYTEKVISVKNADYVFGSEKYISTSYQKIQEKDDKNNYGLSYYGKEKDYEEGNKNYIVVDDKKDTVTYTLRVNNMSEKNFEKVAIINKLPDIDDVGVVNNEEKRNSEFEVKLAEKPDFKINILDYEGNKQEIFEAYYKIEYSDETEFTDEDWDGTEDTGKWHEEKTENTQSFRVLFTDDFILPAKYTIQVEFDGNIQEGAEPGQIAWNSFAYRYYIDNRSLTPEPPKVGVKIPYAPRVTKKAIGDLDGTYKFEIVDAGTNEVIDSLDISVNETKELPIKRTINGVTTGIIESGKKYIIREQANTKTKIATVEGIGGEAEKDSFVLTYNPENQSNITFTNMELNDAAIKIIKKDRESGEKLNNVKYELTDENNNIIKLKLTDGKYIIDENGEETITTNDGTATISQLPFGTYYLREIETIDGYVLEDKEKTKIEINENSYEVKDNTTINIPKELEFTNVKNTITINKKWNDKNIENAELSIINAETNKMISKFITEGDECVYRGLPAGEYILREENPPTGFNKAEDIKFSVNKYGECYINSEKVEKIEMQDTLIEGTIKIIKKGEKLKANQITENYEYELGPVGGVTFELYAAEDIEYQKSIMYKKDECIDKKVTDENGEITFSKLPLGLYYAVEKEAPEEYVVNNEKYNFKIGYNEKNEFTDEKEIINERKKANITIKKLDRDTGKRLEGAEFGLYNSKGTLVETVTTDQEGYAKFTKDIPTGNYTVKEIKAPNGYIEAKDTIKIEFKEQTEFDLTIYNDKQEEKKVNVALPYTGDNLPVITISIIILVVLSNIIEIVIERKIKNKKIQ